MAGTNIYGELIRAQLQAAAADLTPTATGLMYFNTVSVFPKWYTGAAWKTAVDAESAQTFSGVKTLTSALLAGGSLDISAAGNFSLLASVGANTLTIGGATTTVNIPGLVITLDSNLSIKDDVDPTKIFKFQASGITTGTTRTLTVPDADLTIVGTTTTQALTNKDVDGGTASNNNRITLPKAAKATLDALNRKDATLVFATDSNTVYVDYNSTLNELGGAGVSSTITQTAHGFVTADLGAPLYLNGSTYTKAKGDAANTAEVVGLISSIIDVNTFKLTSAGSVTVDTAVSGGALVAGTVYFLSAATAGLITATEPTTVGQISLPLGVAISTTVLKVQLMRGVVVGGSNLRTSVALSNNATTNVQTVTAYEAGEITGWININATTNLRFYVQAQFSKNGAATDWNLAYQVSGDTPPVGFSLAITSGGIIQAVLPSITGFASAPFNYAINAPAVGTTFPLTVSAGSVQGMTDGSSATAGYLGEVISATVVSISQASPTSNTYYDGTGTISLTPGSWLIIALFATNMTNPGTAGSGVVPIMQPAIRTGSTTVQETYLANGNVNGQTNYAAGTIVASVNISSTTIYKQSIRWVPNSGSPTVGSFGMSAAESSFYAVRIR